VAECSTAGRENAPGRLLKKTADISNSVYHNPEMGRIINASGSGMLATATVELQLSFAFCFLPSDSNNSATTDTATSIGVLTRMDGRPMGRAGATTLRR